MRNQVLRYDFTEVNSTIVGDNSGNGAAGVIRNYDAGGMGFETASIYGQEKQILKLPGGADGGYLELPSGILQGNHGVTINFWFRLHRVEQGQMLFTIGKDRALYVRIQTENRSLHTAQDMADLMEEMPECRSLKGDFGLLPCVTTGGTSQEWSAANRMLFAQDRWYMITVTLDGEAPSHLMFYVDAELAGHLKNKRMAADMLRDAELSTFGKGLPETDPVKADFAEIRIYNEVLDPEEVRELFIIDDEARVAADAEHIHLPAQTTEDLELMTASTYGSTIRWTSSDETILDRTGHVTRPDPEKPDGHVTLTAHLAYGTAQQDFEYAITVPAMPSVEQMLFEDAESLNILMAQAVYQDLELPRLGPWGSGIFYIAKDPEIISGNGTVHRPKEGEPAAAAELEAVLSLQGRMTLKRLSFTVLPEKHEKQMTGQEPVVVRCSKGVLPQLPYRIAVYYQDGTRQQRTVFWTPLTPRQLETPGTYEVAGALRDGTRVKATVEVEDPAVKKLAHGRTFALKQTRLTGRNVLTENRQRNVAYLKLLDADRMLYNFRAAFGEDTKGAKPLGGWEEPMGLIRGHCTGHMLSAMAYAYGADQDPEIGEKMHYMIHELHRLQQRCKGRASDFKTRCTPTKASQSLWSREPETWGEGFLSAYSPDQFALLEQLTPYATIWAPYYTLHKLLAGFLDCYLQAGSEEALEVAKGIGSWTADRLAAVDDETRAKMWAMYIAGEYGGMNESLSTLYLITKEEKYRSTAALFDNPKVFDGLAAGRDTIAGIHANQHIPQIIGALQEYKATGNRRYFEIARNFWEIVTDRYMYAIGGVGRGENFKEPGVLAGNIESDRNCETCCAYNLLKLTKELYAFEPEVRYMDYYERAMLNQIAASQNPLVSENMHHGVTYMLPIGPGARREYSTDYDDFTCCCGTGMENHVKYQENVFFEAEDAICVNLYLPAELTLPNGQASLIGEWPGEVLLLKWNGPRQQFRLRVPYWCRNTFEVEAAGQVLRAAGERSLDITLEDGQWALIRTPYAVHLATTPDQLEGDLVTAIMYGPFVMVVPDETQEWLEWVAGEEAEAEFTPFWENGAPRLHYKKRTFIPMYEAHNMRYHTYIRMVQP